jgi:hypothetical protein
MSKRQRTYVWAVIPAAAVAYCVFSLAHAHSMSLLHYREYFDRSDLVVIANPTANTADSGERDVWFDLRSSDGRVVATYPGVQTPFAVAVVLKGDPRIQEFVLRHCREEASVPIQSASHFLFFTAVPPASYLMFLVRNSDGHYVPTLGQADADYGAVTKLQYSEDFPHQPPALLR